MATLWRPGCCFSKERQKRFSQAMFSRRIFSRMRDSIVDPGFPTTR